MMKKAKSFLFAVAMMSAQLPNGAKLAALPEQKATPDELAAARGMEMLMVNNMIQEMRKSIPENEFMPPSHAEKVFEQMLDSEYSKTISESGSIGIADLIIAQMHGKR